MKNNEQEHIERDDHALLTASVFGELSPEEQTALDARLANEPELRVQREAIAATASLVRGSFPAGESLPPELMSGLERAASAPQAPVHQFPQRAHWMRIAAGLTLVCGGAIAANEWFGRDAGDGDREDRLAGGRAGYQYDDGSEIRDQREADLDSLTSGYAPVSEQESTAPSSELFFADSGEGPEVHDQLAADKDGWSAGVLSQDLSKAVNNQRAESETRARGLVEETKEDAQGAPALQISNAANPEPDPAADDAFLGTGGGPYGERFGARGSKSSEETLDRPGSSHGGYYRGPGDVAPPAESAAGATVLGGLVAEAERLAPTKPAQPSAGGSGGGGPAAPGPAAPSSPASGHNVKKLKSAPNSQPPAGRSAPSSKSRERLRQLGYTGPVEETEEDGSGRFHRVPGEHEEPVVIEFDDLDRWQEVGKRKKRRFGDDGDSFDFDERKRDFAGRRLYTADELDAIAHQRSERVLRDCRRLPDERPSMMFFRFYGDNAFELAHIDPQSTFGADVDTASYTLARRYLRDGVLPEKAQIRTEEFVNYFKPDLAPPAADSPIPFAVHTELGVSRYGRDQWASSSSENTDRWMLRVGVRGKEVAREDRQALQLTFVVDTSGSMKEGGRMELVKHALRLLVTELDARDSIALVAFSNEARQVLPMTSAANRGLIETAIHGLNPDGGTNAEAGLMMGYETAGLTLAPGNHSRVVLLSDGVANIGQTDQDRVNDAVRKQRERGIYLNTVGVGMGNHNDVFLEQLANKGDGLCNYVDDEREARRALVENFTGAFETIARDLKVQVEFDPSQVYRYRLLGYENRAIADADFRNDKVDAGEVGAGHQVVALYELELTGNASEAPLAEVKVRWKAPTGAGRHPNEDVAAGEFSFPVQATARTAWESASLGFQRDACVAQFAEIMRRSVHARGDSLDDLIAQSSKLDAQLRDPDFSEFVDMLRASRQLIIERAPRTSDLTDCIDALRRNRILRAQMEELRREQSASLLSDLEQQNAQLEQRIRDLIRQELEQEVK